MQVRAKTVPSFAEKILRKRHKYRNPIAQLTDLCGGRVIVHTKAEVERIGAFLRGHFDIDEENSLDAAALLRPSEFGYQSVHYIIQFRRGLFPTANIAVDVPPTVYGLKAEIQLRTIAQHCWADIGHDRIYKSPFAVPDSWRRESAKIAALLEQVDDGFAQVTSSVDAYRSPGADNPYLEPARVDEEIDLLESVLGCCPKEVGLAHRLARLLINRQRWDRVIVCLQPHEQAQDPSMLFCLGLAWCQKHKDNPGSEGFLKGRGLLDRAVEVNPRHVEAILASAEAWRRCNKERDARERYLRAFAIAPSDPRALGAYVRLKVKEERNLSFVPLIRSSLESAIARCRDQTTIGINQPAAQYSMGEFNLVLGRPYECLAAYASAVQRSDAEFMIDEALETIEQLRDVRDREEKWAGYVEWVWQFLLLAKAVKFQGGVLDNRLNQLASRKQLPLTEPVVIVAGGCDLGVQARMASYGRLLTGAFRDFHGTVISGGTQAGISGLVGDLKDAYPEQLTLVGYVPRFMPAEVNLDTRYDAVIKTLGSDFSALEPLQNWIDLLAAGIKPDRVKLLGINGGEIAAFEYRLAAALGARVGLLRGSGREADALIESKELGTRCLVLPDDLHTVRLYLRQGLKSPLKEKEREHLGQAIHRRFLTTQQEQVKPPDPARADWPDLAEHLKESNRQQADHYQELLSAVGMMAVPVKGPAIKVIEFDQQDVEIMAEIEHGRFVLERLLGGWTLGPRDTEKKMRPTLVPWVDLPEDEKEKDRQVVRGIPEMLKEIGLEIRRSTPAQTKKSPRSKRSK